MSCVDAVAITDMFLSDTSICKNIPKVVDQYYAFGIC